ncbi:MAG: hypothetical protein M3S32_08150 [Acidobacteriota bacterium]|nr:hypothetical protein [Acidobacteriota bacterium]
MLRSAFLLACATLLAPNAIGQTRLEATDIANHPFSQDFASGTRLRLRVRSGEVHVIGTDEKRISVELSGRNARAAGKLKVRLERREGDAEMRISGGPRSDITITIRIPSDTDLYARIPFGEVHVENMIRSQDVEIHAGDLTVDVGGPEDYAHVDASVITGELDAVPFRETHGGLFRSFRLHGTGTHRLHAHVGAGQLTFVARGSGRSRAASLLLRPDVGP